MHSVSTDSWETWSSPNDFISHAGQQVEVKRKGTQKPFLRGEVQELIEDTRGPGIVQFGNYGLDKSGRSIVAILPAPTPPIWPSLPKRSHYQTSFREGLRVPTLDQLKAQQTATIRNIQRWQSSFSAWLLQFEFRVMENDA